MRVFSVFGIIVSFPLAPESCALTFSCEVVAGLGELQKVHNLVN